MLLTTMTVVPGGPCLRLFLKYLPSPFSLLTASFLMLVQNKSTSQFYFSVILLPCVRKIYYQLIFFRFNVCVSLSVSGGLSESSSGSSPQQLGGLNPKAAFLLAAHPLALFTHLSRQVCMHSTRQPCRTAKTGRMLKRIRLNNGLVLIHILILGSFNARINKGSISLIS